MLNDAPRPAIFGLFRILYVFASKKTWGASLRKSPASQVSLPGKRPALVRICKNHVLHRRFAGLSGFLFAGRFFFLLVGFWRCFLLFLLLLLFIRHGTVPPFQMM